MFRDLKKNMNIMKSEEIYIELNATSRDEKDNF